MQQFDGLLHDGESGDGLSLCCQLLPCQLLELEALTVDGVEFGLEGGHVGDGARLGRRLMVVPPWAGFGQSGRAAGGRVGGYLQQRGGRSFDRPAAASDGEVEGGDQVRGRPPAERLSRVSTRVVDPADVGAPLVVADDAAVREESVASGLPVFGGVVARRAPRAEGGCSGAGGGGVWVEDSRSGRIRAATLS